MKRILSFVIVLCMMAAFCGCASAEETVLKKETVLKEELVLKELDDSHNVVLISDMKFEIEDMESPHEDVDCWRIDDGVHAAVVLSIAPSEIGGELSLGDYSEEEQQLMGEMAGEMFEDPEIKLETTPSGNLYIHICSNEQSDIDSIFTIYKGYFVELLQHKDDFSKLSDDDKDFCLSVLHAIEFVEKTA